MLLCLRRRMRSRTRSHLLDLTGLFGLPRIQSVVLASASKVEVEVGVKVILLDILPGTTSLGLILVVRVDGCDEIVGHDISIVMKKWTLGRLKFLGGPGERAKTGSENKMPRQGYKER